MPSLSLSLSLCLRLAHALLALALPLPPVCRLECRLVSPPPKKTAHRNRSFSAVTTRHTSQNPLLFSRLNAAPIGDQEYGNDPRSIDRDGVLDFPSVWIGGEGTGTHAGNAVGRAATTRAGAEKEKRGPQAAGLVCKRVHGGSARAWRDTARARARERERGGGGGSVLEG